MRPATINAGLATAVPAAAQFHITRDWIGRIHHLRIVGRQCRPSQHNQSAGKNKTTTYHENLQLLGRATRILRVMEASDAPVAHRPAHRKKIECHHRRRIVFRDLRAVTIGSTKFSENLRASPIHPCVKGVVAANMLGCSSRSGVRLANSVGPYLFASIEHTDRRKRPFILLDVADHCQLTAEVASKLIWPLFGFLPIQGRRSRPPRQAHSHHAALEVAGGSLKGASIDRSGTRTVRT